MKQFAPGLLGFFSTLLLLCSPASGDLFSMDVPHADLKPASTFSLSLLEKPSSSASRETGTILPNTRLSKRGDLETVCFSPVDSVTHYVGATLGSESDAPEQSVPRDEEQLNARWTLQLGAGVERQLSKRTTFDLDYRFTSSPMDLNLDTLREMPCEGHSISAGMKFLF